MNRWHPPKNRRSRTARELSPCAYNGTVGVSFLPNLQCPSTNPRNMAVKPNRNITRIERLSTGGWLVRVMRRGKLHKEYFSDDEYGKRKGLVAAREYRDDLEDELKGFTAKQLARKHRSNNTSGYPGVRLVEEIDPRWPSQPSYEYWIAQWSPKKGTRKTRRFSVLKYGHEKAFKLAIQARKKGVSAME